MLVLNSFRTVKAWATDRAGTSAIEFALVFPSLLLMLLGVYEVGNAVMADQKTITASQIVADLITRNTVVADDDINNAITAGQLALYPFDTAKFGVDIVSIEFDANDKPQVVWRTTQNMQPDDASVDNAAGLGTSGDGVVVVTASYAYHPDLGGGVMNDINMHEVTYARGRRTAVVTKQ
jgi:Flp pilus assembly protein TadG